MAASADRARGDRVERPHVGWWVAILGGLGLTAVLAFHAGAYALWYRYVTTRLPRSVLATIFVCAYLVHLGEALYARALARRAGFHASARGWMLQTFLLGFPSLRLLRAHLAGR
jgi:Na+-translocating ferredoxin:NAD+ oxidoreductase RnfD subunit